MTINIELQSNIAIACTISLPYLLQDGRLFTSGRHKAELLGEEHHTCEGGVFSTEFSPVTNLDDAFYAARIVSPDGFAVHAQTGESGRMMFRCLMRVSGDNTEPLNIDCLDETAVGAICNAILAASAG